MVLPYYLNCLWPHRRLQSHVGYLRDMLCLCWQKAPSPQSPTHHNIYGMVCEIYRTFLGSLCEISCSEVYHREID